MFFIAIGWFSPSRQQNLACFVAVGTGIRRSERALRNGVAAAGDIVSVHVRMPFGPAGLGPDRAADSFFVVRSVLLLQ